jgi:hypothetical protein
MEIRQWLRHHPGRALTKETYTRWDLGEWTAIPEDPADEEELCTVMLGELYSKVSTIPVFCPRVVSWYLLRNQVRFQVALLVRASLVRVCVVSGAGWLESLG